jgi:hypothetical protein
MTRGVLVARRKARWVVRIGTPASGTADSIAGELQDEDRKRKLGNER